MKFPNTIHHGLSSAIGRVYGKAAEAALDRKEKS
jgi:hypothetical protein